MRGQPIPPTVEKKKPNTVSAAIPNDLFAWIEDYRWTNRMTKSEVLNDALMEWAKSRGFIPHSGES